MSLTFREAAEWCDRWHEEGRTARDCADRFWNFERNASSHKKDNSIEEVVRETVEAAVVQSAEVYDQIKAEVFRPAITTNERMAKAIEAAMPIIDYLWDACVFSSYPKENDAILKELEQSAKSYRESQTKDTEKEMKQ